MESSLSTVNPEQVLRKIRPGMSIFLSTGASEPLTLVKCLMEKDWHNLEDLELIQLVSLGSTVSQDTIQQRKFRLKTFFQGYVTAKAIRQGRVDLIPARFARIPSLFRTGRISADAAFIQVSEPDESGYVSFGISHDVARLVMERAVLRAGEICPGVPRTFGDTLVHVSDFDYLVNSEEPPIYFERWKPDFVFDALAARVAGLIEDRDCLAFSFGPLFEALAPHLSGKRHLGIHTPVFTDALMELVKSGAVTNRHKEAAPGKSLTSYAFGTPELMSWLDRNPLVEFQSIERVFDPTYIGKNSRMAVIIPARKIDLSGRIVLHAGIGNIRTGPMELFDFLRGAEISPGGRTISALPSRNRAGRPNILLSAKNFQNRLDTEEPVSYIVTEFGAASLKGLTVRERAQSLIDIAHPEDREALVTEAKKKSLIYPDQIFIPESSFLYPDDIKEKHTFKGGLQVRFRPIKPSDEEQMRRLFYRFSDVAVYARYFASVHTMRHEKMQEYVNINWNDTMSIVGIAGEPGEERIIAEGRYIRLRNELNAEVAFLVDEEYQRLGISTFLFKMLIRIARKRGIKAFVFDVLFSNYGMIKVCRKVSDKVEAVLQEGVYNVTIPID